MLIRIAALGVILSIGLVPVVASTMRLCEIVMSGSTVAAGKTWQELDSSWFVIAHCRPFISQLTPLP